MNKQNRPSLIAGLIVTGVVVGVVLTANFGVHSSLDAQTKGSIYTEGTIKQVQNNEKLNIANFNPNQVFTEIVEKVRPSIVSVYTTKTVSVQQNPFYEFFGRRGMPQDENHQYKQQGSGSGIIISKDGYVITNNHVVEDMDELQVKLIDNREFPAEVIGRDPKTDIALLKIDGDDLPISVLGNSDNINIGEWVMAFGSPLGLTSTVTAGIVSAIGRNVNILGGGDAIEDYIQTDAAINPGNSGGALVNVNGEVIGVNSAIATRTNYYMGYGFAIPINIAKSVIDDLMKFGEVRRGYLGVYIEEVDPVDAKGVGLDKPKGVLVTNVQKDKAADKAGVEAGDVILAVNGVEVNQPNELQAKIGTFNPGDEVNITLWHDGKKKNIDVVLLSAEGQINLSSNSKKEELKKGIPNIGMSLKDLSSKQLNQYDLDSGVIVADVDRYSKAAEAGIRPGDVIYEVDKKSVDNVHDFNNMLEDHNKGDVVRLKVRTKQQNDDNFDRLVFMQIPDSKN